MANKNPTSQRRPSSNKEFALVIVMLGVLFALILALLVFAYSFKPDSTILAFSKDTLSILVGAFGAWIGAGAAYFFGKENLAESSASTEEALKIALGGSKPKRIMDLTLATMNKEFMFYPDSKKAAVLKELNLAKYNDYWWVPVFDRGKKGVLEDVIHARVFWEAKIKDDNKIATISDITSAIDNKPELKDFKALHGTSFFVQVASDDEITDVIGNMVKSRAAVGVIVDENGKPTGCFTRQDLQNLQK